MSICGDNACAKCKYTDRCVNSDAREQTNEEWFANLTTEEKADVLNGFVMEAYYNGLDGKIPKMHCYKDFQHWLKEKHDG